MILKGRDSAVSPVIGILLMLVVTIIIAAVVSGFAGSLASDQSTAPQITLSVKGVIQNISDTDTSNWVSDYPSDFEAANGLLFEHKGGDSFSLNDIYIQLQSDDTKIILTPADVLAEPNILPDSVIKYVMEIGDNDGFIKPGDRFMVYSDNCRIDEMGSQISWKPEGSARGFATYLNTKCEYKIIDKASSKVMQQGTFVLQ